MFLAQDGEHQVRTKTVLYVLEGLLTNVILGLGFLNHYNLSRKWVDPLIDMPCLEEKNGVC